MTCLPAVSLPLEAENLDEPQAGLSFLLAPHMSSGLLYLGLCDGLCSLRKKKEEAGPPPPGACGSP